jgi:uncharacterized protein YyaL (SSP411 family)
MIRVLLLHISLVLFLNANVIDWQDDYESAHAKAIKENKIFYIFIAGDSCHWCRKMERTTMLDNEVINRLNKDYIAVELIRGFDDYPDLLQAKMVPKHYFLTPNEKKIYSVPGYWNTEDFSSILDDVTKNFQKYKIQ